MRHILMFVFILMAGCSSSLLPVDPVHIASHDELFSFQEIIYELSLTEDELKVYHPTSGKLLETIRPSIPKGIALAVKENVLYIQTDNGAHFKERGFFSSVGSPLIQSYPSVLTDYGSFAWHWSQKDRDGEVSSAFWDLNEFLHENIVPLYTKECEMNAQGKNRFGHILYKSQTGHSSIFYNPDSEDLVTGESWHYTTCFLRKEEKGDKTSLFLSEDAGFDPTLKPEKREQLKGKQQTWELLLDKETRTYSAEKKGSPQ